MSDDANPSIDSVETATRIVLNLTGRRWIWPALRVVEVYEVPASSRDIFLDARPVIAIESVTTQLNEPVLAELSDGFRLRMAHQGCCSAWPSIDGAYPSWWPQDWFGSGRTYSCPRELTVTYTAGSRPPGDIQRAIMQLAGELDKMMDGGDCQLPSRVTSINRQGYSMTLLDPLDFVEKGRTGLYFVDLVIASYGGRVHRRARVFSPEHRPPRRLSAAPVI